MVALPLSVQALRPALPPMRPVDMTFLTSGYAPLAVASLCGIAMSGAGAEAYAAVRCIGVIHGLRAFAMARLHTMARVIARLVGEVR